MEVARDKQKPVSIIAHVDMDCFYCAVERSLDASLNGVAMAGEGFTQQHTLPLLIHPVVLHPNLLSF